MVQVPSLTTLYTNEDCQRRGNWVRTTCPESLGSHARPGIDLTTSWSQVWRPTVAPQRHPIENMSTRIFKKAVTSPSSIQKLFWDGFCINVSLAAVGDPELEAVRHRGQTSLICGLGGASVPDILLTSVSCDNCSRVARSPVFYGRSRISDPFSCLPGGSRREEQISRVLLDCRVTQTTLWHVKTSCKITHRAHL